MQYIRITSFFGKMWIIYRLSTILRFYMWITFTQTNVSKSQNPDFYGYNPQKTCFFCG